MELLTRAAEGELPDWAVAGESRRAHMSRVADLLGAWAGSFELPEGERVRWRAVGHLHDALRDEEHEALHARVPVTLRDLPGPLLHGPAAAELLRADGVLDGELLRAVAFHTVGDPSFHRLGRALYAADFLEPGRTFLEEWRGELRGRMPSELDQVVFEIVQARVANLVDRGMPVLHRTIDFWNRLVEERR